jgi:hypothetical protein
MSFWAIRLGPAVPHAPASLGGETWTGVMTMAEAEPEAAQPKVKVLRRTSISPKYIKADAELQHAATQYLTAIAEFSDKLKQVEEASANLKQKLVPKLGFDGEVDWRVIADERVKGGLVVEEIQKEPTIRPRD